jgi:XTP/dITP diphosphohydrolase
MKKQIVLATHNKHKIFEIKNILSDIEYLEVLDLSAFPEIGPIIENGKTLESNALIKAEAVFKHTNILALADDTGLMVDYLLGAPGVYSARYAGENVSYEDNYKKLLKGLAGVPPRKRTARFKCCMALVDGKINKTFETAIEGKIATEPHGKNGFGYDPIFIPVGYTKTYAELSDIEKNKISHRYKSLVLVKDFLKGNI